MLDLNQLFEPLAGTAVTASADSTNILDLGVQRDTGAGDMQELHVLATAAFTAAGSATMQIALQGAVTSGGTYYDIALSPLYAVADLTIGRYLFQYKLPKLSQLNFTGHGGAVNAPQFLKLRYTVATGPFLTGKLAAWLTGMFDRDETIIYPRNYTV